MRDTASHSSEKADEARLVIKDAVELGRLPADLGQILLHQLPAEEQQSQRSAAVQSSLPNAEPATSEVFAEDFDEPTIPQAVTANIEADTDNSRITAVNAPIEAQQIPIPPVGLDIASPPAPKAQATTPPIGSAETSATNPGDKPFLPPLPFLIQKPEDAGDDMRAKIDDVVLSSLVGDFKAFRQNRNSDEQEPQSSQKPEQLDHFLSDYTSARFRSDARRAAGGNSKGAKSLDTLGGTERSRAGIGTLLRDRFILDEEIGRGGMGIVYAAVDRRRLEAGHDQPYVALKLLNDSFRNNPRALQVFEAEARKAQKLAHPNIVTVFDFDRDKSEVFIAMELLKGEPLNRRLARAVGMGLPTSEVTHLLSGICSALTYAHSQGVIHSDLKPGNVFILEDETVKLLDFGLATAATTSDSDLLDALTAPYASPEMFENAPRDPRDDIFALGCIAYQALSGNHPFAMKSSADAAAEQLVPSRLEDLDDTAWAAISSALKFNRDERTATVRDFAADLFQSDAGSEA